MRSDEIKNVLELAALPVTGSEIAGHRRHNGKPHRINYDPDIMLDRAIKRWCKDPDAPQPSHSDSYVDCCEDSVTLANVNGTLAIYKISSSGRLLQQYPKKLGERSIVSERALRDAVTLC